MCLSGATTKRVGLTLTITPLMWLNLKKNTYEPVYTVSIYHILTIFQENCNTELFQTVRD
jgi:hypothetical protein